jgi:hypothetical protein
LGDKCPINPIFDKLYHNINLVELVQKWKEKDWKVFIWTLHLAVRKFMRSGDTSYVTYLNHQVQYQLKLNEDVLPTELRRNPPPVVSPEGPPDTGATKRPAHTPEGPRKRNEGGGDVVTTDLGDHLQHLVIAARSKIGVELRAKLVFPTNEAADKILGAEYMALVSPSTKRPCLKAHVFGKCPYKQCGWAHTTSSKPSKPVMDSIATRLQARFDELAIQHPK